MKTEVCTKPELDLWTKPPLDGSNEDGWWSYYKSSDLAMSQGEITIDIKPQPYYIDLSSISLYVRARVYDASKTKSTELAEEALVSPVNNFLHSLFKQVSVKIDDQELDNSNSMYHYKSYFYNLLNHGHEAKNSHMTSQLFYKDDANEFDNFNIDSVSLVLEGTDSTNKKFNYVKTDSSTSNSGFIKRRKIMLSGKGMLELCGPLYCDFFNTNKLLIDNTAMSVKLWKNDDAFLLNGKGEYKIYLEDVKLRVRHQKINPMVRDTIERTLQKSPAIYPYRLSEVKSYKISTSGLKVSNQTISTGFLPKVVIIALAEQIRTTGKTDKNPFLFSNFNVTEVDLRVDSQSRPYSHPIELNYSKNLYLDGYNSLYDIVNNPEIGNNISREDFAKGYSIYAFNLQPTISCNGDFVSMTRNSNVTLTLKFAAGSSENLDLDLIVYTEHDKIAEIDIARKVKIY